MFIKKIKNKFVKLYYPFRIRHVAAECGHSLACGGKSYVTSNSYLGNHVNFNGMGISGRGKVVIGNYFHSGPGCQIITSFHNYEGDEIPYDDKFIDKNVTIGDCVWLGNNVIVLGGGIHRRRSNYTSRFCCLPRYSANGSCWGASGENF